MYGQWTDKEKKSDVKIKSLKNYNIDIHTYMHIYMHTYIHIYTHTGSSSTMLDVWAVDRQGEKERHNQKFKKLENRRLLWHGTNVAVVAPIITSGICMYVCMYVCMYPSNAY